MHSPFSFFIFVMKNSLLCCFDPRKISDTFELFKDCFNVLLVLLWRVDPESSHNASMVTSHVNHVVCLKRPE